MARIKQKVVEDLTPIEDTTINYELHEDYFRSVANSTVKPVLERLSGVYARHGKRYPWNHIVAVGLRLYSLHKSGIDIDINIARAIARKFGTLDDAILRDIVNAIQAEETAGRAGRR